MTSFLLNALGFQIKDGTLVSPDTQNDRKMKKIRLGIEQLKMVKQQFAQKGKKENMCRCYD
jgi:hypothetical protein